MTTEENEFERLGQLNRLPQSVHNRVLCLIVQHKSALNSRYKTRKFSLNAKVIKLLICFSLSFFSVRSVMHKYLEKENEVNFDKIFNQILGK